MEIIKPIKTILKSEELTKTKYQDLLYNEDHIRKLINREIIRNTNYVNINRLKKIKMIYIPKLDELITIDNIDKSYGGYITNSWLTYQDFINLGNVNFDKITLEISNKNEIKEESEYVYYFKINDIIQLKENISTSQNKFITIPISLSAPYINNNTNYLNSEHIGLYIIDTIKKESYFFDPNGIPSYFENIKKNFSSNTENNNERINNSIFDDINLTFNEYAMLTNIHKNPNETIINRILTIYSEYLSIKFIKNCDFYKYTPNSADLSAKFDDGSCLTWHFIMEILLHCNKLNYDDIIQELCNMTMIDSKSICYQFQSGLHEMLEIDLSLQHDIEKSLSIN